MGNKVCPAFFG